MTAEIKARDPGEKIFWIALLLLFTKLILLPFAQNTDPDAVLRVLGSGEWKNHPAWITSGAWAPFHFYLNGIFLMLWNHPIYMPVVLNMLLSSLTLFPFYYFTRREFDKRGAFIATIFLAICPVLFRNSLLPLSETPYLLFMVLTMNLISKGTREEKKYHFLLAGLSITIASGFRYEAWFMIVLLGIVILLLKKWKGFFLFGSVAVLFPVLWMFQSHWATGNSLNSFQWAFHAMNNKEVLGMESYLRRTWFFPFSWMIALGPPAAFVTAREMIRCYRRENRSSHLAIWTLPFWAVLLFFFYNDMRGSLLLQHRFSGTLIIFSLPFFALYFKDYSSKKTRNAWAFGILTVGLSFAWNT
ncbi:MAG: glycosyltransferase family 39 protein, partial [Bacteroidetes bacterium]|nr:glycosyltransferase family 39 protein [Bacteroidota bacterium]